MTWRGLNLALALSCVLAAPSLVAPSLASPSLAAPGAPPGAASCAGCHSPLPGVGAAVGGLAGLGADGIAAGLAAYRTEERATHVMGRIARGFTEAESRAIAEWIAAGSRP